ncbi:hypothetical protein BOTBODRAFT_47419 [Botryobasidium botryosum FD-172 SS1]|uniref:Zn(2)-C6 fungal-type domain-containing protein n=1 Tax=Botryobasidium botryosum (strain FD-172 SS1) TaxID=930990 RepID=A0A067M2R9_BOTB1|nr:hypothetical protein BOTBODRAFT_47419 [Botryobasidium botryosum FD-172 SS1]
MVAPQNMPVGDVVNTTLAGFNQQASALFPALDEQGEPIGRISHEYVRYTTQGRCDQGGDEPLAALNVYPDQLLPRDLPWVSITRDYDSLIGHSPLIHLASGALTLHVHADPSRSMTRMPGIVYDIPSAEPGILMPVNIGRIPNYRFASIGDKVSFMIAFPALHNVPGALPMREDLIAAVYDDAIRPSLPMPIRAHFPASYRAETIRDRTADGVVMRSQGHILNAENWPEVQRGMLERFETKASLDFARGAFFIIQVKGAKLLTPQVVERGEGPEEIDIAAEMLTWLPWFDFTNAAWGNSLFYIDVAMEYSLPDSTVHWRTDCHAWLFAETLGHEVDRVRGSIEPGQDQDYFSDQTALLLDIAGAWWNCTAHHNDLGIVKFNIYTTDKTVSYMQDKGRWAKFIDPEKVIRQYVEGSGRHASSKFVKDMGVLYDTAREVSQPGAARFEVRVPLRNLHRVLREPLLDGLLLDSLVAIPADVWTYKMHRMTGLGILLTWTTVLPLGLRARPECLTLAALCCYLLNALNSRPDTFNQWRQLARVLHPVEEVDGTLRPVRNGGTMWLHHVILDPGPGGATYPRVYQCASERTLCKIFKVPSLQALVDQNDIAGKRKNPTYEEGDAPRVRHNNRQRLVTAAPASVPALEDVRAADRISLASVADRLRDTHLEEAEIAINNIWNSFPSELIKKSPTQSASDSWLFDPDPSPPPTHEFFKSRVEDLHTVFRATQIRLWDSMPRSAQWKVWTTCFHKCFPVYNKDAAENQMGYPTMAYRHAWMRLTADQTLDVKDEMRRELLRQFDKYTWFPSAQIDRPWPTGEWAVPLIDKPRSGKSIPRRLGPRIMTRPKGEPNAAVWPRALFWPYPFPLVIYAFHRAERLHFLLPLLPFFVNHTVVYRTLAAFRGREPRSHEHGPCSQGLRSALKKRASLFLISRLSLICPFCEMDHRAEMIQITTEHPVAALVGLNAVLALPTQGAPSSDWRAWLERASQWVASFPDVFNKPGDREIADTYIQHGAQMAKEREAQEAVEAATRRLEESARLERERRREEADRAQQRRLETDHARADREKRASEAKAERHFNREVTTVAQHMSRSMILGLPDKGGAPHPTSRGESSGATTRPTHARTQGVAVAGGTPRALPLPSSSTQPKRPVPHPRRPDKNAPVNGALSPAPSSPPSDVNLSPAGSPRASQPRAPLSLEDNRARSPARLATPPPTAPQRPASPADQPNGGRSPCPQCVKSGYECTWPDKGKGACHECHKRKRKCDGVPQTQRRRKRDAATAGVKSGPKAKKRKALLPIDDGPPTHSDSARVPQCTAEAALSPRPEPDTMSAPRPDPQAAPSPRADPDDSPSSLASLPQLTTKAGGPPERYGYHYWEWEDVEGVFRDAYGMVYRALKHLGPAAQHYHHSRGLDALAGMRRVLWDLRGSQPPVERASRCTDDWADPGPWEKDGGGTEPEDGDEDEDQNADGDMRMDFGEHRKGGEQQDGAVGDEEKTAYKGQKKLRGRVYYKAKQKDGTMNPREINQMKGEKKNRSYSMRFRGAAVEDVESLLQQANHLDGGRVVPEDGGDGGHGPHRGRGRCHSRRESAGQIISAGLH